MSLQAHHRLARFMGQVAEPMQPAPADPCVLLADERRPPQLAWSPVVQQLSQNPSSASAVLERLGVPMIQETERNGGELVAEVLRAHGVRFLFTLSGGHISPILTESEKRGIRVVDVRHEANAVFAADAVARLTGVPGVAVVTAGPGVTNTITAAKNAQMAQSPLVLIGGAAATQLKGRGSLQDIEQIALFRSICKWSAACTRVRDIVDVLRRAFQQAMSGVPGPVFVEFPIDVLYPVAEARAGMGLQIRSSVAEVRKNPELTQYVILPQEAKEKDWSVEDYLASKPQPASPVFLAHDLQEHSQPQLQQQKSPKAEESKAPAPELPAMMKERARPGWVVDKYMRLQLWKLYAGAFRDDYDFSPLPTSVPVPDPMAVNKAVALLRTAQRPVMILASQATLLAPRMQELRKLVQGLGLPVFLSGMARGLLGAGHPCHIKQNRAKALKQADLILLVGAVCDFRLDYGRVLPKTAKVIAVNRSKEQLNLNRRVFWDAHLQLECDPGLFLFAVGRLLGQPSAPIAERWAVWRERLRGWERNREQAILKQALLPALSRDGQQTLVNPIKLFQQLEEMLPEHAVLVADGGDFVATGSYVLSPRSPLSWLDPGAFGTLGVGGGFALGAKLCRPEAEVWLIWGDGSAGYSLAEYDTFRRHKVPVIGLIGNDAGWTQIERDQVPIFGSAVACPLLYSRYDLVAEGYGGRGLLVEKADDVEQSIKEAQRLASQGEPVVINCLIGKTSFREGSISV